MLSPFVILGRVRAIAESKFSADSTIALHTMTHRNFPVELSTIYTLDHSYIMILNQNDTLQPLHFYDQDLPLLVFHNRS